MSAPPLTAPPTLLSPTTALSLLATLAILTTAYLTSRTLLPLHTPPKLRLLYIWHLFDALIHLLLESSFLYNCFFTYLALPATTPDYPHPASLPAATGGATASYFLGRGDRLYGSAYGSNPPALLWQEYAKADHRWGGADLTVVSLELLTVFIGGPLALYVTELIRRGGGSGNGSGRGRGRGRGKIGESGKDRGREMVGGMRREVGRR